MRKQRKLARYAALIIFTVCCTSVFAQVNRYTISTKVLAKVEDNIFGQFLEKASWGDEIGADVLIDPHTGKIRPKAYAILKDMHIPIIRFPGGTDIDFYPWYNLIDNVPNKHIVRPPYKYYSGNQNITSDNAFGLDEFLKLSQKLNSQPLLVVNFGDAFFRKISIAEAAKNAAALVTYCNAEQGNIQDSNIINWPQIRRKNGHSKPWKVKYFEIGNEPRYYKSLAQSGNSDSVINHYFNCLNAIVDAMRAVDPSIQIITDGEIKEVAEQMRVRTGDKIQMLAYHTYRPWAIDSVVKNDKTVDVKLLSNEDIWKSWVAVPSLNPKSGQSEFAIVDSYADVVKKDYPIAITEWNWNGWWGKKLEKDINFDSPYAKGLGAAGFLHAIIRGSDRIKMGCQSLLVGKAWGITAIRVSPQSNEVNQYPTGKVNALYARYHGNNLLQTAAINPNFYVQPYQMTLIKPHSKVAYLDLVATQRNKKLFVHIINRNLNDDGKFDLDLSEFKIRTRYKCHLLTASDITNQNLGTISHIKGKLKPTNSEFSVPKHSVAVFEFDLK